MKGRCAGVKVSIDGAVASGAASFTEGARLPAKPSAEATRRLEIIGWYREHGRKARLKPHPVGKEALSSTESGNRSPRCDKVRRRSEPARPLRESESFLAHICDIL